MSETSATIADAVDHVIEVAAGLGTPSGLVGHSLGGQITLLAQVLRPELFAAEIVIDPAYGAAPAEAPGMSRWADDIERRGPAALSGFFAPALGTLSPETRNDVNDSLAATDGGALASYLRSEYLEEDSVGLAPRTAEMAARRARPVLAIHSSERGAEFERSLVSPAGSAVTRWDGFGHFLQLEDPTRFATELSAWLRALHPPESLPHGSSR